MSGENSHPFTMRSLFSVASPLNSNYHMHVKRTSRLRHDCFFFGVNATNKLPQILVSYMAWFI